MKKKLACMILSCIALICSFAFASCDESGDDGDKDSDISHVAQPLHFDSVEEAASFIEKGDVSDCSGYFIPDIKEAYDNMLQVFGYDGYVLKASSSVAERINDIVVYPQEKYCDVGVQCWFDYDGVDIRLIVYRIDDAKAIDFEADSSVSYRKARFDIENNDFHIEEKKNVNGEEVNVYYDSEMNPRDDLHMICFIDPVHYIEMVVFKSSGDIDYLIDFFETLTFEKINFIENS